MPRSKGKRRRYQAPPKKKHKPSPKWFGWTILLVMGVGVLMIVLNYLGVMPGTGRQANNLYLELLADTGVLGLAAFVWLTLPALAEALRTLSAPIRAPTSCWLLGCSLGVLAFLVHGVLDSFLAFTPTALLFWMLLAMILNLSRMAAADATQKPHVSGR